MPGKYALFRQGGRVWTLVAPLTLRAKVVYKAVQRGCASSVGVTIVNAGAVYLIDLLITFFTSV
jgi:hypothetical protein